MQENWSECYLSIACLLNMESRNVADKNELDTILNFIYEYVSDEDKERYENVSSKVVKKIALKKEYSKTIYTWIYNHIVLPMVVSIYLSDYDDAYQKFMDGVIYFESALFKSKKNEFELNKK